MPIARRSPRLPAGLPAGAGITHFLAPRAYDRTIPEALPGAPRPWTYASGAAELALAAGVAHPRTRRLTARAVASFFVGAFPPNIQMAVDWRHRPAPYRAVAIARLPLQAPLVWWARSVSRTAGGAR